MPITSPRSWRPSRIIASAIVVAVPTVGALAVKNSKPSRPVLAAQPTACRHAFSSAYPDSELVTLKVFAASDFGPDGERTEGEKYFFGAIIDSSGNRRAGDPVQFWAPKPNPFVSNTEIEKGSEVFTALIPGSDGLTAEPALTVVQTGQGVSWSQDAPPTLKMLLNNPANTLRDLYAAAVCAPPKAQAFLDSIA